MPVGHGHGPMPTRIMIVGEAWGESEDYAKEPFVGPSGAELNKMLHEAGIMRTECYVTNLVNARPPNNDLSAWIADTKKAVTKAHVPLRDRYVLPIVKEGYLNLIRELEACNPNVVVPCGNAALWAMTGQWGVMKWRGSLLQVDTEEMKRWL